MEKYKVILMNLKNKKEMPLLIEADEAELTENVTLKAIFLEKTIYSSNEGYLQAYQELRDKFLQLGYGIKCNGSRINAVQSAMMSATNQVYLVKIGEQALKKDIVNIFDYAAIEDFPDTKQQFAFFKEWIKPKI